MPHINSLKEKSWNWLIKRNILLHLLSFHSFFIYLPFEFERNNLFKRWTEKSIKEIITV